jgi:hypothetical protein
MITLVQMVEGIGWGMVEVYRLLQGRVANTERLRVGRDAGAAAGRALLRAPGAVESRLVLEGGQGRRGRGIRRETGSQGEPVAGR